MSSENKKEKSFDDFEKSSDIEFANAFKKNNLISSVWSGDAPLLITYWLFGSLVSVILVVIAGEVFPSIDNKSGKLLVLVILICYQIFSTVAIWRSSKKYKGKKIYRHLARIAVCLGWLGSFPNFILSSFYILNG